MKPKTVSQQRVVLVRNILTTYISYNHNASSGNQWNVPVGLFVSKVIKVGKLPMKVQGGLEYSVVSADDFGKRANFRFVITPVIPGLIQKPIFGGK